MHRSLDLAVVGNGVIAALVDSAGEIVWLGWPDLDSPPVADSLLGGTQGVTVQLEDQVSAHQDPMGESGVLVTTLLDRHGGVLEVRDHAPLDPPAPVLVRRLLPIAGAPRVRHAVPDSPGLEIASSVPDDGVLHEPAALVLSTDPGLTLDAAASESATADAWQQWLQTLQLPDRWRDASQRAARALRHCCHVETGGILAALTTSIPEAPDTTRNWDYRYCWLRDAWFALDALVAIGANGEAGAYRNWLWTLLDSLGNSDPQPLYSLDHSAEIPESLDPELPGYRGMGPVRIGNEAAGQAQHDVFAQVILSLAHPGLDAGQWARLEHLGERAWACHNEPDAGPWELRNRSHVHTWSAASCFAACARLARHDRPGPWAERATQIRAAVLEGAWNEERGCFTGTLGGSDLDASTLLLPHLGLLVANDRRFVSTVEVLGRELGWSGHIQRYDSPDDLGVPETAFTICSFWYIEALARLGRVEEATHRFKSLLAIRNRHGLLSEDVHPDTGELWGNFPQVYSHVGLLRCAALLA